jgi:hypothetical protein
MTDEEFAVAAMNSGRMRKKRSAKKAHNDKGKSKMKRNAVLPALLNGADSDASDSDDGSGARGSGDNGGFFRKIGGMSRRLFGPPPKNARHAFGAR